MPTTNATTEPLRLNTFISFMNLIFTLKKLKQRKDLEG